MKAYLDLIDYVLATGQRKPNRTGTDTISAFNYNYTHDLRTGFPLLTTKRINWLHIVVETLWYLTGAEDVSLLHKHGLRYWDPWVGSDGKVPMAYGRWWRWDDQLQTVLDTLRTDWTSRRLVVTPWCPSVALSSPLPPCHLMWILNVQLAHAEASGYDADPNAGTKRLCLHLTQRSADIGLGVPYNLASYALLLTLLARFVDMEPGVFGHTLVDAHAYVDHVDALQQQRTRLTRELPELLVADDIRTLDDVLRAAADCSSEQLLAKFRLVGYQPHPAIKLPVAV